MLIFQANLLTSPFSGTMDSLEDGLRCCTNDRDVTLFVLNHMVMPLTPQTKCFVDDHSKWRFVCPDKCKNKALESVEPADTSIGEYCLLLFLAHLS